MSDSTNLTGLDPQKLIASLPGFIYVCDYDDDWTMRFLSDSAEPILGYAIDDLIGNRAIAFSDLIHPDDREAIAGSAEKNLADRQPCEYEYRIISASGAEKWVWERSHGIYDGSGNVLRIEGYIEDITERVELERELVNAAEHERNRIGRDLHDSLGQRLTGMSLGLEVLAKTLDDEQSAHAGTVLKLRALAQKLISETRRVARDLSPGLSGMGINEALKSLASEINEHSGVQCRVQCSGDTTLLDEQVSTHLYRIAQECVNNVLRHAAARNIELNFGRDGNALFLEVLDDGIGIPQETHRLDGLGLKSMQHRARIIRGRLDVAPRTTGGTRVRCSCPYQFD